MFEPPVLKRKDVLTIMHHVGMGHFCAPGVKWIKQDAPDEMPRELFMDDDSLLNGYLDYLLFIMYMRLHDEVYKKVDVDDIVKTDPHSWTMICDAVSQQADRIRGVPVSSGYVKSSDVYILINKIGIEQFCKPGLDWLKDTGYNRLHEIGIYDILGHPDASHYLSYFVHMCREKLGIMVGFDFGQSNSEWFISENNLTDNVWAYICGSIYGAARRFEFERPEPST